MLLIVDATVAEVVAFRPARVDELNRGYDYGDER